MAEIRDAGDELAPPPPPPPPAAKRRGSAAMDLVGHAFRPPEPTSEPPASALGEWLAERT